jgi:tetratricopeptide (TPR) repeat protein
MKRLIVVLTLTISMASNLPADDYFSMKKEAYSLYHSGKHTKSKEFVKRYIEKNPKDVRAKNLLAVLYYWDKEYLKAKNLLEEILSKREFAQSRELLAKVKKRLPKRFEKKTATNRSLKESTTRLTIEPKPSNPIDLNYMIEYVKKHPKDFESRKTLSKYYYKIGEYEYAYKFAKEAYTLKKDKELKNFINTLHKKIESEKSKNVIKNDREDISKALAIYERERNYTAYFNLYRTLMSKGVTLSESEHATALYAAILLKEYKEAKNIVNSGVLHKSEKVEELSELLDRRLSKKVVRK